MSTDTLTELSVWLPLPPIELSKNGRAHWSVRNDLYQEHKMVARSAINALLTRGFKPWTGNVSVHIVWRYKRNHPDRDNTINRVAAYVDGAEQCSLFIDDSQVSSYQVEYVKDSNEGVLLTFTHEGSE